MKPKTYKRIIDAWDAVVEENDDDASTEYLIWETADRASVEYGTVVDALQKRAEEEAKT